MTDSDTLYLASTSPRRRQLLAEAGIAFELFAISVDEEALSEAYQGPLNRLGEYLARQKALATYAALQAAGKPGRALAADTTVLLGETHLAKPADFEEGRQMLRMFARTRASRRHRRCVGRAGARAHRLGHRYHACADARLYRRRGSRRTS